VLAKIESGTVAVEPSELRFDDLSRYVERTFRHVAETKKVDFRVQLDPSLPRTTVTDIKRLQQIIKNLLSNAFKFTHVGHVSLSMAPAVSGWSAGCDTLEAADHVIAFKVSDTGIGICRRSSRSSSRRSSRPMARRRASTAARVSVSPSAASS